jgi:hypothetical protein
MGSYLDRYQQGEFEQVWQELYALGASVHQKEIYPDAWAVAVETMRRVRHNIEILIPRLEELGYQFGYEWLEEERLDIDEKWIAEQPALYAPPRPDVAQQIQHFEDLIGFLPLSVCAFYSEVGEVNFFGRHLYWEHLFEKREGPREQQPSNLDPLTVIGLREETFNDYIYWRTKINRQEKLVHPYPLIIAVDYDLKYNISGSGAYEIELPDARVDAPLLKEWHQTTFVNYLRICFHYGGLPGLEFIRNLIPDTLEYLRKDLLPI